MLSPLPWGRCIFTSLTGGGGGEGVHDGENQQTEDMEKYIKSYQKRGKSLLTF